MLDLFRVKVYGDIKKNKKMAKERIQVRTKKLSDHQAVITFVHKIKKQETKRHSILVVTETKFKSLIPPDKWAEYGV